MAVSDAYFNVVMNFDEGINIEHVLVTHFVVGDLFI